jgi:hypothetical protein
MDIDTTLNSSPPGSLPGTIHVFQLDNDDAKITSAVPASHRQATCR